VFIDYESINLGYTKAFEKLISFSTGDYIAFCDQDDIWHEDKIKNV
jgi:glycosyltransferase involved in cell wall biosynthesis